MMSDRFRDSLSEYLDGELEPKARREIAAHLEGCAECAAVLEDLRALADRTAKARALEPAQPHEDLWPGIEARLRAVSGAPGAVLPSRRSRADRGGWAARRVSFSLPQLAAACLALVVLSGSVVWIVATRGARRVARTEGGFTGSSASLAASDAAARDVENLRRLLASSRQDLDPVTVRSLEESIVVIDIAIRQAQRALEADPHNPYVRDHLDETMRRKVDLMRRATQLASTGE